MSKCFRIIFMGIAVNLFANGFALAVPSKPLMKCTDSTDLKDRIVISMDNDYVYVTALDERPFLTNGVKQMAKQLGIPDAKNVERVDLAKKREDRCFFGFSKPFYLVECSTGESFSDLWADFHSTTGKVTRVVGRLGGIFSRRTLVQYANFLEDYVTMVIHLEGVRLNRRYPSKDCTK